MDLGIEGRVAVVSGASSGIGRASALTLAAEGCQVVMVSRTRANIEEAASEVDRTAPGRVEAVAADMTDPAGVSQAVQVATDRFGQVDIVMSNVTGYTLGAPRAVEGSGAGAFETAPPEAFRDEFRHLVLSGWLLAQATLGGMKDRHWGRIVNIGSRVAREPDTSLPHVLPNISRPAAAGVHRLLARRLAPWGITVNNVLTGDIETGRGQAYRTALAAKTAIDLESLIASQHQRIPVRRYGKPAEMAAVVAFLCSDRAGRITGQSIPVDGGMSRHL
jgi:3-oxoacyl-[acyl-carrier protein] reductase